MSSKASLRTVSRHNTKLIEDMIRESGRISRYEIAKRAGLSPNGVHAVESFVGEAAGG